jgi:6-pyruvoyl-tetrahydropterin synthase
MNIEKKYHFYAAHRNKFGGEKCGRIHGHTYRVKILFKFDQIDEGGITCLFNDIDLKVEPIIKSYCHWLLLYQDDPLCNYLEIAGEQFKSLPFETSAENLALYLFSEIYRETKLPIVRIELQETESSTVIYDKRI